MADIFTKRKRSWIMGRIKGKDTKLENLFAKEMKESEIRFRKHPKLQGNPDFNIIGKNTVVFVDGCFWHGCPVHYREPKTKKSFWVPKIERNVKRDKEVNRILKREGYRVIRIWEHDIKKGKMKKWVRKIKS